MGIKTICLGLAILMASVGYTAFTQPRVDQLSEQARKAGELSYSIRATRNGTPEKDFMQAQYNSLPMQARQEFDTFLTEEKRVHNYTLGGVLLSMLVVGAGCHEKKKK
jgi:hypothetical protein